MVKSVLDSLANVRSDLAFKNETFVSFLNEIGAKLQPVPPRRHYKNVLESKHCVIRSIYLQLRSAAPDFDKHLHCYQYVAISNELYGSDTVSAFELAKGFTKPVETDSVQRILPADVRYAHEELKAKRKLNLILRSHKSSTQPIKTGDMVQVFIKNTYEKRGRW